MSLPIISVEGLSKRFRLESMRTRSLRELFRWPRPGGEQLARPGAGSVTHPARPPESFWALRDLSFEVARGEVIAIIGPNGAGKSTLLKILSRITQPTEGRAVLRGRTAALLEVGTGFHPELSGRENIFLNGAILGMKHAEIARKLEAIVEFADVGRLLDTPVKRYSSGMHVRLAFAVAAHLDPDILIVDEVLAVGDALFQKKCLGKMQDVSTKEGRTVLFVSHNMQAVQALCGRGLHIEGGQLVADGPVTKIVAGYLARMGSGTGCRRWADASRPGNEFCRLNAISVRGESTGSTALLPSREAILVDLEFEVVTPH